MLLICNKDVKKLFPTLATSATVARNLKPVLLGLELVLLADFLLVEKASFKISCLCGVSFKPFTLK
jgi:hypothetical protein